MYSREEVRKRKVEAKKTGNTLKKRPQSKDGAV
jgi:hypothetical protein